VITHPAPVLCNRLTGLLGADRQPLSDVEVNLAVGAEVQPEQRGEAAMIGVGEQCGVLGIGEDFLRLVTRSLTAPLNHGTGNAVT
jgi:hypothetical protein